MQNRGPENITAEIMPIGSTNSADVHRLTVFNMQGPMVPEAEMPAMFLPAVSAPLAADRPGGVHHLRVADRRALRPRDQPTVDQRLRVRLARDADPAAEPGREQV